ncbi:MAG: DNA polymerase III subunit delta [Christensenellales bacterium]
MKFEDLKVSFKKGFKPAYLLIGSDEFLLSTAYNLIVKYSKTEYQELNVIKFSEGIIDGSEVVRALNTLPVFSDKKIVLLDLRMSRKSELKNVKILNEYLINPNLSSILIINIGANEDDFGLENGLLEIVDCNRLDGKIVNAKIKATINAKGKTIDEDACDKLMEYSLCDLSKIMVECDKLVAFVGDRENITIKDIEQIVTRSIEYQVFELTDALAKKNSSKVYSILNDMEAKKDEYKMLPSLIYSHFRRLFHIALNSQASNLEIARMLGIKEYAVKMSRNQTTLFTKSSLKKINELCASIDYDLKQSNISLNNAIELIVLTILNLK